LTLTRKKKGGHGIGEGGGGGDDRNLGDVGRLPAKVGNGAEFEGGGGDRTSLETRRRKKGERLGASITEGEKRKPAEGDGLRSDDRLFYEKKLGRRGGEGDRSRRLEAFPAARKRKRIS